ncbi:unnamed protein product, partial [Colletotrichum noveboracense]
MSASLPGSRELPASQYDLSTYWGRARHSMGLTDPSTLLVGSTGLEQAKSLLSDYKQGKIPTMTPELWKAKKVVDSTLHPDTGEPVLLPFRMSAFVLTNLVVTAGMLQPGLGVSLHFPPAARHLHSETDLTTPIDSRNNRMASCQPVPQRRNQLCKREQNLPLTWRKLGESYAMAVSVSCGVAVGLNKLVPRLRSLSPATRTTLTRLVPFAAVASAGALNVLLMRGEEIRKGIDVFPRGLGRG